MVDKIINFNDGKWEHEGCPERHLTNLEMSKCTNRKRNWSNLCPAMKGYWEQPPCGECWGCLQDMVD